MGLAAENSAQLFLGLVIYAGLQESVLSYASSSMVFYSRLKSIMGDHRDL